MNTTIHFMPNGDTDRLLWMQNFAAKLPGYASALNISIAEINATQRDLEAYSYVINMLEMIRQTEQNVVAYKDLMKHARGQQHLPGFPSMPAFGQAPTVVPEGVFDRISKLSKRIKASVNYSDAMGHDLGIIAPSARIDAHKAQPNLKVHLNGGLPVIAWKKGKMKRIKLLADRQEGAGWELLGYFLRSPYMDKHPVTKVAEWKYKAQYMIDDRETGLMSLEESILVRPI